MKEDLIKQEGIVVEILKGDNFKVKLKDSNHIVTCKPAGKLRMNNIMLTIGDEVSVEISPYDLYKGRIVYREKGGVKNV